MQDHEFVSPEDCAESGMTNCRPSWKRKHKYLSWRHRWRTTRGSRTGLSASASLRAVFSLAQIISTPPVVSSLCRSGRNGLAGR